MADVKNARRWRGKTPEERVAERREQLLDAALEVFTARGFHATKVRDVCREAGLTERYFYESFPDGKESLLEALALRIVTDLVVSAAPSIAVLETDMDAAIRGASRAVVTSMTQDKRRARVLFVEMVGVSPPLEARRREWIALIADIVRDATVRSRGAWAADSVEVELHARALVGAVQELLIAYARDELELDRELLVASVTRLLFRAREALDSIPAPTEGSPR